MKLQGRLISTALLGTAALLAACDDTTDSAAASGAVFAMTNAADNNQILGYQRTATGALTLMGQFSTGGRGSGPNPIAPPPHRWVRKTRSCSVTTIGICSR